MATGQGELTDLIADARLVIAYAARIGQLQGPGLALSASSVEASLSNGGPTPGDYATFLQNLNAEISAIAPVTLVDLGSTWTPFPTSLEYKWFNRSLVVLGVLLIATVAFYTQFFTVASETLSALHTLQVAEAEEKLDRLKLFLREHPALALESGLPAVPAMPDPPAQALANVQDLAAARAVLSSYVKELRIINESLSQIQAEIFDLSRDDALYPPWIVPAYHGFGAVSQMIANAVLPKGVASPTDPYLTLKSQEQYLSGIATPSQIRDVHSATQSTTSSGPSNDPAIIYQLNALIDMQSVVDKDSRYIEFCKKTVFVLGNWLLPALYGLVGSIVFQMRRVLSPMQPSLPPVRLLFRIALGGFAGIIVTWFWSPSVEHISAGESISITAFGAAFLVGYSSEIFFVLLDTMVNYALTSMRSKVKATT